MYLFTGGTVYLEDGFHKGVDVLVKGKRIARVGVNISPPKGCKRVKLTSKQYLLPGLIDAHTHLGVFEDGVGVIGNQGNEYGGDPNTAHIRAMDAIFPQDIAFEEARDNGVLAAGAFPGSANLFGGLCATVRCYGDTLEEMLIDGYHGMKMALGENPFRVYGSTGKSPTTRMAVAGIIRKTLIETQNYMAKRKEAKESGKKGKRKARGKTYDKPKHFDKNLLFEHLALLLDKKIVSRFHMHRRDDIETALRLKEEFGFNTVLDHCTEGYLVPNLIAKHKVPVVIGPMDTAKVKYELKYRDHRAPFVLYKAGVNVSFMTDHPVMPIRSLRMNAALAVRGGLTDEEALMMMTVNPAKLLNIDKDFGSIAKGKLANLAVYSGEPLDMRSDVVHVWIEGEEYK